MPTLPAFGVQHSWLLLAILSAVFAAMVSVFGKLGMKEIDSTVSTAIRSVVMTLVLVAAVPLLTSWSKASAIPRWGFLMISLSGLAGALSWLAGFRAIQIASVSRVMPIDKLSLPLGILIAALFLNERPSTMNWTGVVLMTVGAGARSKGMIKMREVENGCRSGIETSS